MSRTLADSRQSMTLADGRVMAYTVTGPADGVAVLYCHGAIGTPVNGTVDLEGICEDLGVAYIAPSRPGIGGSDPAPGRTIGSWAEDARQLIDHLGYARLHVAGVSAGGPYALALAHLLASRVSRVAVVSSLSPLCPPHATPGLAKRVRLPLAALHGMPAGARGLGNGLLPVLTRHPGLVTRVIAAHAAPSEQDRLASAAERVAATASFFSSCSDGVGGLVEDYRISCGPWGFDLAEVDSEVDLWHGVADPLVPVEHALQLAAALPHCRTFFDAEEGHHFFRARLELILEQLLDGPSDVNGRPRRLRLRRVVPPAGVARPGG